MTTYSLMDGCQPVFEPNTYGFQGHCSYSFTNNCSPGAGCAYTLTIRNGKKVTHKALCEHHGEPWVKKLRQPDLGKQYAERMAKPLVLTDSDELMVLGLLDHAEPGEDGRHCKHCGDALYRIRADWSDPRSWRHCLNHSLLCHPKERARDGQAVSR